MLVIVFTHKDRRRHLTLVLQHHWPGQGCGASSNDHKIGQSERCTRTDGKKWRCKIDALLGLKYCMQHLHRGVKKVENGEKSNPCLSFSINSYLLDVFVQQQVMMISMILFLTAAAMSCNSNPSPKNLVILIGPCKDPLRGYENYGIRMKTRRNNNKE
ncbi:hypothetical protein L1987_56675 [Smallanthus sonchifolius]|uniref:Uncharacterized protein n=1 Tax=Smallanthus sonchifolius TaxID=185202 RepID=A0ACB9EEI6_9ASTR|nr:hypothetical protein L1987_56675 [Smallanthus sonchifolius]